jgi:hypothetical protein
MSNNVPNDPGERMEKIVAESKGEDVYSRLPKAKQTTVQTPVAPRQAPSFSAPPTEPKQTSFKDLRFGPAFWNVTGVLSLVVNGILLAILLILFQYLGVLHFTSNDIGTSLVGGLFTNFEKMDAATIQANIPVDAQIPLDINVPVQTTTEITLAQEIVIPNAHVRITTPNVNIDSDATVTLPAGTPLLVNLNFSLPVRTSIPVHLDVPVNIPMNATELHEPFVGLQEVIRPLYCILEPDAKRIDLVTDVCVSTQP